MKKLIALVLALAMLLMVGAAFADGTAPTYVENSHDVTITTNGESTHEYSVFQIFKGDLDQNENKLSNIIWGDDIKDNGAALITALAANNTIKDIFAGKTTAREIAEALGANGNTAGVAQAFADAVNTALGSATTTRKASTTNGSATITVPSDGYYFIKDTGTIGNNDTKTRFMLQVLNDLSVTAKDTKITPDKKIEGPNAAASKETNDANIGDEIQYKVTIPIPDTKLYKDHFVFQMNDTLDTGLTFKEISSITVGGEALTAGTNYTLAVSPAIPDGADLVTTTGGQTIKVTFVNFKSFVETPDPDLTGNVVIQYSAILNSAADFGVNSNDNTVFFKYSNDPNYKYDGDNPDDIPNDVIGNTPTDTTKTYSTKLKISKVDGNNAALAGAVFEITGTHGNKVVETGDKYVANDYTLGTGEQFVAGTYYLLKDGTYTATAPVTDGSNADTSAQYDSTTKTYKRVHYNTVSSVGDSFTITRTSDANGIIELDGLRDGTFTVQEITAPAGYNIDNTLYTLKIDWHDPEDTITGSAAQAAKGGFTIGNGSNAKFTESNDGAEFSITIVNNSGTVLPSTGGIGTTIFYIIGGLLVIGAAVILVARRKAHD